MSNRLIQRILLYHCFRIVNLERNSEMNMLMLLFFFLYLLPMECFRVAFEPVMRKHNFVFKVASSRWHLQFYALIKTEVEHRSFFFSFLIVVETSACIKWLLLLFTVLKNSLLHLPILSRSGWSYKPPATWAHAPHEETREGSRWDRQNQGSTYPKKRQVHKLNFTISLLFLFSIVI